MVAVTPASRRPGLDCIGPLGRKSGALPIHGIIFAMQHWCLPFSHLRPVIHLGQNASNVPAAITTTQMARRGRALAV